MFVEKMNMQGEKDSKVNQPKQVEEKRKHKEIRDNTQ